MPGAVVAHSPSYPPLTPPDLPRTPAPTLPPESHPAWTGLITGALHHEFHYAAAGMLVFNLNLQWKRDPGRLPQLIEQVRAFFHRYHALLSRDMVRLFI